MPQFSGPQTDAGSLRRSCGPSALTYGIGSSNNSAAGLQGRDNACFGDGNALLFHGFVDAGPILIIHLQERKNDELKLRQHTERNQLLRL